MNQVNVLPNKQQTSQAADLKAATLKGGHLEKITPPIDIRTNKAFLPESGFIRLPDVLKLIPVGKSTWWHGTTTGRFPKPIKLGKRISAWRVEDIRKLIENPHLSLPFRKEG